MKILHILYQSLPDVSGSSIRSRDILLSQKEVDIKPIALTSPFQPSSKKKVELINGITYIRAYSSSSKEHISDSKKHILLRAKKFFRIIKFFFFVHKIVKRTKPDVIHAHATFFCGVPAVLSGKLLNIPVVYEVRSIWEKIDEKERSSLLAKGVVRFISHLENFAVKKADFVIALNENLKKEILKKLKTPINISVIPNAVNVSYIDKLKTDTDNNHIIKTFKGGIVFGYIGTLTPYEGLDFLIKSFYEFNKNKKHLLKIYGSGVELNNLKNLLKKTGKDTCVELMGQVRPELIARAYSNIDVIINPRIKNEITDNVTPLKPLEAMAYEKPVIVSNVGGMLELVEGKDISFVFEAENIKSLNETLKTVVDLDLESLKDQISRAKGYVINNKSWYKNAISYKNIYKKLLDG